ncbi:4Fe-4S binding protein [Geoglobus acetivorans]|uniref:Putative iron-sulfur cluster binding protein YccM n=1 Tax=Geoglobus acetivorans TaxID=565033 RepID=A0A0A7GFK1_GEOAI|nr:putative iron-sulfur cluster binding protein YccM [Geoglobus acetivorans]
MNETKWRSFIIEHYRRFFQVFFFTLATYSWVRLYLFVKHFDAGWPYVSRPVSIEAFLPIGALVSLKNLIVNHYIDPIHPAALVIFLSIILSAVLLKRGFCGWVCPVGFLSEMVSLAGKKISGKNLRGFSYARIIKYLLLLFFLYLILPMRPEELTAFIFSPYWAIADVKLLDFWLKPGTLTIAVTALIIILTLFVRNFWCRFLCPYGALLSILSYLSPARIEKTDCTYCRRCDEVCPSFIEISERESVNGPECIMCLECVKTCPHDYLSLKVAGKSMSRFIYPLTIVAMLFGFFIIAKLSGHWDSILTYEDYKKLLALREFIGH